MTDRQSNIESIIKAAHDKGHTFIYAKSRRVGKQLIFSLEFPAPRKETK